MGSGVQGQLPLDLKFRSGLLIREQNAYNNGKATELATPDGSVGRRTIEHDGSRDG